MDNKHTTNLSKLYGLCGSNHLKLPFAKLVVHFKKEFQQINEWMGITNQRAEMINST